MNSIPIQSYRDAGCAFWDNSVPAFTLVYTATRGRVCDTGCAWYADGRCAAYRAITAVTKPEPVFAETVRAEAARKGVSISEVRRQRAKQFAQGVTPK